MFDGEITALQACRAPVGDLRGHGTERRCARRCANVAAARPVYDFPDITVSSFLSSIIGSPFIPTPIISLPAPSQPLPESINCLTWASPQGDIFFKRSSSIASADRRQIFRWLVSPPQRKFFFYYFPSEKARPDNSFRVFWTNILPFRSHILMVN